MQAIVVRLALEWLLYPLLAAMAWNDLIREPMSLPTMPLWTAIGIKLAWTFLHPPKQGGDF
jgi:hypothetical protein